MTNPDSGLHGMLLEEVLVALLRSSGYVPLSDPNQDPRSLGGRTGFLKVRGRGCEHQVDVVADFKVHIPFTNPLRLLLESKCVGKPVGVEIVRNAVGVLKDVSEFWHVDKNWRPHRNRHHYQYVVCSSSGYTVEAQKFAFVHDVNLIQIPPGSPLDRICQLIRETRREDVREAVRADGAPRQARRNSHWLSELRLKVREWLRVGAAETWDLEDFVANTHLFQRIIQETAALGDCYLTFLGGRFPVLLVPADQQRRRLPEPQPVRIFYNRRDLGAWSIESSEEVPLFYFKIPTVLLQQYLEDGFMDPVRATDLKRDLFSSIQVLRVEDGQPRWFELRLDQNWIAGVRDFLVQARQDDLRDQEREDER